jgi:hypothetical protein
LIELAIRVGKEFKQLTDAMGLRLLRPDLKDLYAPGAALAGR